METIEEKIIEILNMTSLECTYLYEHELCEIIEYINRTGYKKELFISKFGGNTKEYIRMVNMEMVDYYKSERQYINVTIDHLITSTLYYAIIQYDNYLHSKLGYLSETQMDFIIEWLNFRLVTNNHNFIVPNDSNVRIIIEYKRKFINNPEKISNLKKKLFLTDNLYNNIEAYGKSKGELILYTQKLSTAYEKLATFIETLDNYSQDTKDDNDIIVSRKALDSVLDVINEFNKN